jgi:hypothetical protein
MNFTLIGPLPRRTPIFCHRRGVRQYAVALHEGSPDGLAAVTDPAVEHDPGKWTTEVAIRLAG